MATRDRDPQLTRRQVENARASISVGVIIQRLSEHVAGKIEMTPTQVKSAQVLLDKSLPTLQAIDQAIQSEVPDITPEELEVELRAFVLEYVRKNPEEMAVILEEARNPYLLGR
jgi:hypothetical protein